MGIIKNINPDEVTSIKESLEPCGMATCVIGSVFDQYQYGKMINTISIMAIGKKIKKSLYRLKANIMVDFATTKKFPSVPFSSNRAVATIGAMKNNIPKMVVT